MIPYQKEAKQYEKTLLEKITKEDLEDLVTSPHSLKPWYSFAVSDNVLDELRASWYYVYRMTHPVLTGLKWLVDKGDYNGESEVIPMPYKDE